MARIEITKQVARIIELGGTHDQVRAAHSRVTGFADGTWYADNVGARTAVDSLEAGLQAAKSKAASAAEIIDQIRAGKVLYTRASDGQWLIWGREDVVTGGATVTATRKDGSTQAVVITRVGPVRERNGLRYRTAEFRTPRSIETDPMDEVSDGLTGPAAEALRIGRSYGVNGQIWDNA